MNALLLDTRWDYYTLVAIASSLATRLSFTQIFRFNKASIDS